MRKTQRGNALPTQDRQAVAALVREHGENAALEQLGISRQTLGRCLGGLPVLRGTVALVQQRLRSAVTQ
jgi:hypothetical protein